MADRTVGELPRAPGLYDDSLLVMEQQGAAQSLTGAQLKNYAREGVNDYVEDAKKAAEAAQEAVKSVGDSVEAARKAQEGAETARKAIEDLEVTADTLPAGEPASVEKTAREGHVWLKLGIPQGPQGEVGPVGPVGPEGPRGPQGAGLTILGQFDTPEELESAVSDPAPGAAYNVGTEPPYNLYTWDEVRQKWMDNGVLQGPPGEKGDPGPAGQGIPTGGTVGQLLIKNSSADYDGKWGDADASHITFSKGTTGISSNTVQGAVEELFTSVSDGKKQIASAVTDKGVATSADASFSTIASNIKKITTGASTGDATATAADIRRGQTAYGPNGKITGTMPDAGTISGTLGTTSSANWSTSDPNRGSGKVSVTGVTQTAGYTAGFSNGTLTINVPANRLLKGRTVTPTTSEQTIANAEDIAYGAIKVAGDPNLIPANIVSGKSIFGVSGTAQSSNSLYELTTSTNQGSILTFTLPYSFSTYNAIFIYSNRESYFSSDSVSDDRRRILTIYIKKGIFQFAGAIQWKYYPAGGIASTPYHPHYVLDTSLMISGSTSVQITGTNVFFYGGGYKVIAS